MNRVRAPRSTLPVPGGRLVALLTLAVVLLGSLTGNAFSLHVGMDLGSSAPAAAHAADRAGDVATGATTDAEAGAGLVAEVAGPMLPSSSDAQHLMHLLGACLALLAGAVLLLLMLVRRAANRPGDDAPSASHGIDLLTRATWIPPSLDPPTSSPVIRA